MLKDSQFYSTPELAKAICVKPSTLESWRHRGVGPPYLRLGDLVRYRGEDVNRWIEESKCE